MIKYIKKNKGETLVESILSIMILSCSMIPINDAIIKIYNSQKKINAFKYDENYKKNIIEIIKSIDYEKISKISGKYTISTIKDLENILGVNINGSENYIFKEQFEFSLTKLNIKYIDKNKKEKNIYLIKLGDREDYYYPDLYSLKRELYV